jgi:predicted methyltransferase
MRYLKYLAVILPLAMLAACGKKAEQQASAPAGPEQPAATASAGADAAAIDAALANPGRLAGDSEQDGWRKSAEVLRFLELRPGMHVVDYFAAGGYNAELMSYVVGPQGQVIAYNNEPYLKFAEKKPAQRYGNNRLPNVVQLTTAPEEAPFEPASLDAALFVQAYHDLYWKPKDNSWSTDPAKSLAKLVPALRPGAVVVVVDHVAPAGADPAATVDALHRIDPAVVKRDFEAAGLVFDAESDVLRNPADDHTRPVFDESIRRKTDQIVYRFRKP